MKKEIIIATWNLSGGRLAKSSGLFDYEDNEQLDYFVNEIQKVNPDIICLPETHLIKDGESGESLTRRLATKLGFEFIYEAPLHPSHIDSRYMLGIGFMSRLSYELKTISLPSPLFPLYFESGKPATAHVRPLLIADFGNFVVATNHNWPMQVFGKSYDEEPAASYGRELSKVYLNTLPNDKPLVFAGDFNFDSPEITISEFISTGRFREALSQSQPTRNVGDRPDHILFSPGFEVLESKIIEGDSEHYLCYAKLRLS
jgi:exonuclease III